MRQLESTPPPPQTSVDACTLARHPWVECAARAGYAARGVMYLVIGGAWLLALTGAGGRVTGFVGTLRHVLSGWFGVVLVAGVVVGLSAHAVWSLFQALADPERRRRERREGGEGAGRWGYRAARALEGVVNAGLAAMAVGLLVGWRDGGDDNRPGGDASWAARVMAWPGGVWVVAAVGVGLIVAGALDVARAWRARLDAMVSMAGVPSRARRVMSAVSRFGVAVRGVTFALVGAWLVVAAWDLNANEAKGLGGAMRDLGARPFGRWALGLVALGWVAYGGYELVRARFRKIGPGPADDSVR